MASQPELGHSHHASGHGEHSEVDLSHEWFRHPRLIINPTIQSVGYHGMENATVVSDLASMVITQIADEFEHEKCSVIDWDGKNVEKPDAPLVIINPVHLGSLPDRVKNALVTPDIDRMKAELREYLPELPDPLIQTIGSKHMKLEPTLHPNFINMLLVDDSDRLIRSLPSDRMVIFSRFLMAKLGAFKTIIVPYSHNKGEYSIDKLILGTLEGGHPSLSAREVARRLMVFGSSREVGGFSVDPDLEIPYAYWTQSPTVSTIRQFGRFLGSKGLLSPPVEIKELPKNPRLAEKIIRLLDYTRQAEGALWGIDPVVEVISRTSHNRHSIASLPLVTASGTSGAVKTDLKETDIIPIIPQGNGTVMGVSVEGQPMRKPSVEAEEFTLPLMKLPKISFYGITVPAFRAGFHIHRGFSVPDSKDIVVIPTDITAYPPVGCGVDLMHRMSLDAMQRARAKMAAGNPAILYLFAVPNHGTNGFIPWGNHENPFQGIIDLIEQGDLVFTPDVPQV